MLVLVALVALAVLVLVVRCSKHFCPEKRCLMTYFLELEYYYWDLQPEKTVADESAPFHRMFCCSQLADLQLVENLFEVGRN